MDPVVRVSMTLAKLPLMPPLAVRKVIDWPREVKRKLLRETIWSVPARLATPPTERTSC